MVGIAAQYLQKTPKIGQIKAPGEEKEAGLPLLLPANSAAKYRDLNNEYVVRWFGIGDNLGINSSKQCPKLPKGNKFQEEKT